VTGEVEQLFVAERDSAPMESVEAVEMVRGGIEGDRYCTGEGYYSPTDVCEVTLLRAEAIEEIREAYDIDLTDGRHRRNVVTRGTHLYGMLETTFRVGDAVLRGTRPRPPCRHVERVAGEAGVQRALRYGRGGICADVVEPGTVRVDDVVEVVEEDPRTIGRRIVDRLRGGSSE
jgi:MOSC domain-containing protein YiiM